MALRENWGAPEWPGVSEKEKKAAADKAAAIASEIPTEIISLLQWAEGKKFFNQQEPDGAFWVENGTLMCQMEDGEYYEPRPYDLTFFQEVERGSLLWKGVNLNPALR